MCRKWKKTAALCLAVLIGGMMPMNTMLAAEEDAEVVQEIEADSDFDAEEGSGAEIISDDNESIGDEGNADAENVGDEVNADDENLSGEVNVDDVIADDEVDPVNEQNVGIEVMSASDAAEAGDAEVQENTNVPVISITLNGEDCKVDGLGGSISYKYTNVSGSKFGLSASLNGAPTTFSYFLDENPGNEARDSISSSLWKGPNSATDEGLSSNKSYVVYVKAGKNEQTVYARSCGVVVDTIPPEIVGVEEGKTYPAGTTFTVSDANLDVVMVNEKVATPESDGSYRVRANGTSCVIRAKDKAGNEKTCSITVSGGEEPGTGEETPGTGDEEPGTGDEKPGTGDETPGTGDEKPGTGDENPGTGEETPETNTVISVSGVYALKVGVKYHLASGSWKVDGDKSLYQGDSDFYVKKDGDYKFSK